MEPDRLLREINWSATSLGTQAEWPRALRTVLSLLMRSHRPQYLVWGPEHRFFYNQPFLPVMGIKHPSGFGQPMAEVWPEVWDEIEPLVRSCIDDGESHYFEDRPFVLRRRGYDEQTYFSFSYTPVEDDGDKVAGLMCVLSETTQAVESEARRTAELRRMVDLFSQAPGFVCVTQGPDHRFSLVNGAFEQVVGRTRDELLGRPIREAQPELEDQHYLELLDNAYRTGEHFVGRAMPCRLRRGDEEVTLYVDFVYQPIFNDHGAVTGIFVQGSDVTARVDAERNLRASEEALRKANINKDRFLAVLSHELRNPLAPIHTANELLRFSVGACETSMKCVEVIGRQVTHMSALVEDVFDVARVSSGRVLLKRECVDLNAIVGAAVEQMRPKSDEKRQSVIVELPPVAALVDGDRLRLTQVMCNLLANSIRYTPVQGNIRVTVSVAIEAVCVSVEDDGIGMSADMLPSLFELFAQANPSPDRTEGGLGLGLSLVKALIDAHGGDIVPSSGGVGQGSQFRVTLPLAA